MLKISITKLNSIFTVLNSLLILAIIVMLVLVVPGLLW